MKRWGIITVLLYAANLLALTVPVLALTLGDWWGDDGGMSVETDRLTDFYSEWMYWVWFGVLVITQVLLLVVPIRIAERRPPPRRPVMLPIVVTSFLLGNLFLAGGLSFLVLLFGDNAFEALFNVAKFLQNDSATRPITDYIVSQSNFSISDWEIYFTFGFYLSLCWLIWLGIFYRYSREDSAEGIIHRAVKWLLRGSILELLVAVPSHIVVRHRDDCCAPAGTFWGITTGLAVMLLAFGPGVFFLFVERCRRLRPPTAKKDEAKTAAIVDAVHRGR